MPVLLHRHCQILEVKGVFMKKHYDTLTIGHISLDYNIDYLDNQIIEVGGAVIYSSAAAYAGGFSIIFLSSEVNFSEK